MSKWGYIQFSDMKVGKDNMFAKQQLYKFLNYFEPDNFEVVESFPGFITVIYSLNGGTSNTEEEINNEWAEVMENVSNLVGEP
jgi:hypothetical protein